MTSTNGTANGTAACNGDSHQRIPKILPLPPNGDGVKSNSDESSEGRDSATGRFTKGHKFSVGNPFARRVAALRTALLDEIQAPDIRAVARKLHAQALAGDVAAATLLFRYTLGRGSATADPDQLDEDEWERIRSRPSRLAVMVEMLDGIDPALAKQVLRFAESGRGEDTLEGAARKIIGEREDSDLDGITEERRAKRRGG